MGLGSEQRSDNELACEAQAGSFGAFEELVVRFERRVYSFVLHQCANGADAAEITQDTFVKAFQSIHQFQPRYPFASWLFTIARRKCIDLSRAQKTRLCPNGPEEANTVTPADHLSRAEEGRQLWATARKRLSADLFQAVWLHYAEDLPVLEVARVMRKTRVHVKVMLYRARRILAAELDVKSSHVLSEPVAVRPRLARFELSKGKVL